ncbi:MAG: hypothetical protein JWQ38_398 [Flavipsychrobacter sp.]|nr:hypothetical protein [Flavipsychrobacter sp.]
MKTLGIIFLSLLFIACQLKKAQSQTISTYAGVGTASYSGDVVLRQQRSFQIHRA